MIEQGLCSPGDIVLQHKEHVLFENPRTGLEDYVLPPRMGCIAHCAFLCMISNSLAFTFMISDLVLLRDIIVHGY